MRRKLKVKYDCNMFFFKRIVARKQMLKLLLSRLLKLLLSHLLKLFLSHLLKLLLSHYVKISKACSHPVLPLWQFLIFVHTFFSICCLLVSEYFKFCDLLSVLWRHFRSRNLIRRVFGGRNVVNLKKKQNQRLDNGHGDLQWDVRKKSADDADEAYENHRMKRTSTMFAT